MHTAVALVASISASGITGVLFSGIFGVAIIFAGIRRLMQARLGPNKLDAIVWGIIGIAIGFAFISIIVWFMTPFDDPVRPNGIPDGLVVPSSTAP